MLFFNILINIGEEQVSFFHLNRSVKIWLLEETLFAIYPQLLQVVVNGERIDGASVNEEVQVEFPQDRILRIAEFDNIGTS